jgi:hypothetical protein
MKYDEDKVDEVALALMYLTLHDGFRAWKGLDWNITDRLYQKGLIENPVGKAKSLALTEDGLIKCRCKLPQVFQNRSYGFKKGFTTVTLPYCWP